jgi:hypothetical protein
MAIFVALTLSDGVTPFTRAADAEPQSNVQLDISTAKPRAVEALTAQRIVRDYGQAWANLAEAFNGGNAESIGQNFTGVARDNLIAAINSQKQSGVHSRYLNQTHKLEAVFYSPEGDVMKLHDTATCDLQVLDGTNVIRGENVTLNYIVLMTPGADRWVVRQIQAVPSF